MQDRLRDALEGLVRERTTEADSYVGGRFCTYCNAYTATMSLPDIHKQDCPVIKAQEVLATLPAPDPDLGPEWVLVDNDPDGWLFCPECRNYKFMGHDHCGRGRYFAKFGKP